DLVAEARQVARAAAPDQDDRVLLEVVTLARDVRSDLNAVREAHTGDLPERRVRLPGRGRGDARADPALLRGSRERRGLDLRLLPGAALANQLIDGRHAEAESSLSGRMQTEGRRSARLTPNRRAW